MSIDLPAALADEAEPTNADVRFRPRAWLETALTVLFVAVAILSVSFITVVASL